MALDRTIYWAAAPVEDIGQEISDRVTEYYECLSTSGILQLYRSVHCEFYGLDPDGGGHETSTIIEFGDDGEKLGVRSNQLRSLVRYMLTSATADRPSMQPKAINNSAVALAQVPTARKVLEYFHKSKRLERKLKAVALRALLYGKGYLWSSWDPTAGRKVEAPAPVAPPTETPPEPGNAPAPEAGPAPAPGASPAVEPVAPPYEGDIVYKACSPLEVSCDLEREDYDHDWFIVRQPRNRYDLIAVFCPDATDDGADTPQNKLRDQLLDMQKDILETQMAARIAFGFRHRREENSDVYVYHFLHKRTPAMPQGRYVIVAGDGVVLFEGPLPYDEVPVNEMIPEEFMEAGSIGYASAWDLIGLQHAYDSLLSTCMTNFDAFGHNDILIPAGVELGVEEIREGLNAIRYPQGEFNKPSMLEKFSVRGEVFTLKDWLKSDMELVTGVNSVARGEPEASLKSGAALALVQAQAIHFQSGFLGSFTQLIEDSGTDTLRILKRYAKTERLASIAGSGDPDGLIAFKSSDIDQIDRVEVEQGNPVFRTLAGKFDMANNLLERGLIKSASEYYQVLETGRLEPVSDPQRKMSLRIQEENELLMKGPAAGQKPPPPPQPGMPPGPPTPWVPEIPALMGDHPAEHIRGHLSVLDSQENRTNQKVCAAVLAHVMEHLFIWRTAPKDFLMLMEYPLPPPLPGDPIVAPPEGDEKKPEAQGKHGQKANPKGDGTQEDQKAPDEGSGVPSLPKPAKDPLEGMR